MELQSDDNERLRRLAAQLVEYQYVLAEEPRPGVGKGYKAHVAEVRKGPGKYSASTAESEKAAQGGR